MMPSHATIGADVAHLEAVRILQRWQFGGHRPWRDLIACGRGLHIEGFVWALEVECLAEAIECALLGAPRGGRGAGGLSFECTMHALMAAVLLGFAGLDEFREDPQADPPGGQL